MILLKILIMAQNGVNGTFWGPKIDFFKHFSKAVFYNLLIWYLLAGIKKCFNMTILQFKGNLLLCPNVINRKFWL